MPKLLVADNSDFIRETIKDRLKKLGLTDTEEAVDGVDAVKKFKKEKPDVVVIDAAIDRLDGLEATKKMKEINPGVKIVLISILGRDLNKEAMEAGASKFVQFPFEKDKLAEAVNELL